jgi:hypothetical protein
LQAASLTAPKFPRLENSAPIKPASERRVARKTPGLFGEKDENALRHFLRSVRVTEHAQRGAMHEPEVTLDH